ncbi:phenylalanyl-tRNA synthetase subunit alpha [Buchnera aphidicola (Nipponaphis monzeni)]|uniref:Phenylalanine--tRNA ligase alpha subunit n=1 Tax=Buchnera aphidicola (Nipponaphis monzeni) TaxID=2495405 RepID=A0A455T9U9_9GAMM|nr:phenylalanyl-tRNA synthetase subunit alpha [Buchnera aphidicola (Nipponaphis monzeni)]
MSLLKIFNSAKHAIKNIKNLKDLEIVRIKYLGKKGYFSIQLNILKKLKLNERKNFSILFNEYKKKIQELLTKCKTKLKSVSLKKDLLSECIDISLPGRKIENGSMHPITITIDASENFFYKLGFNILTGPEIENDYYNFDALNISKNHPARESHDTFRFSNKILLRTQTSSVQIRAMEKFLPPFKVITSGKVYRHDYDITHTPMFHQIEGLIIDKNISFSNLKWIMYKFLKNFFHKNIPIRFRSAYFPFTVPSAEIDIQDVNGKWIEVLGCGIVHPNVLKNVNIDTKKYSACAFGIGVERITMLKHEINDLRYFYENDLRFIKQFK